MILLSALALAAAATPETTAQSDPVVCQKREVPMVGTRIKQGKICMKRSEWAEMEKRTGRSLQKIHNHSPTRGLADGR